MADNIGTSEEELIFDYDELIADGDLSWVVKMGDRTIAFPKSNCSIDEEDDQIYVPQWLAEREELI